MKKLFYHLLLRLLCLQQLLLRLCRNTCQLWELSGDFTGRKSTVGVVATDDGKMFLEWVCLFGGEVFVAAGDVVDGNGE